MKKLKLLEELWDYNLTYYLITSEKDFNIALEHWMNINGDVYSSVEYCGKGVYCFDKLWDYMVMELTEV